MRDAGFGFHAQCDRHAILGQIPPRSRGGPQVRTLCDQVECFIETAHGGPQRGVASPDEERFCPAQLFRKRMDAESLSDDGLVHDSRW